MVKVAKVVLWGEFVGALAYDKNQQAATFEYAPDWIKRGVEISPIRMPLSISRHSFPSLSNDTYKGLPSVFADTLPDDFGNAVINAWLAQNGRDVESFTPIERLLYIGNRGVGALEYEPSIEKGKSRHEKLELSSLLEMAQRILDQRAGLVEHIEQKNDNAKAMQAIFQVGTSAGGARAKALIAINQSRNEIRSGQADAPKGFEHYLLKFDGVVEHKHSSQLFGDPQGFGRMEYAYYLMAKDAGINMSPSELLIEGERAHFMTKRFDRDGNDKKHYVSLCAMDHADYKKPGAYSYEELMGVARSLKLSRKEAIEIFRRMVFNVVARNQDDHSKNVGFILPSINAKWELAPAFDVAYSYRPNSEWVQYHQLSINGKRDNFLRDDLLSVASLIGNFKAEANSIIDKVVDVVSDWPRYARKANVFPEVEKLIKGNHRKL